MYRVNSSLNSENSNETWVIMTSATRHVSTESQLTASHPDECSDVWRARQTALSALPFLPPRWMVRPHRAHRWAARRTMDTGRFGCDAYGAATSVAVCGVGAHFISISFETSSHRPDASLSYNYSTKGSRECTCRTIPYANVITKLVTHYYIRNYV